MRFVSVEILKAIHTSNIILKVKKMPVLCRKQSKAPCFQLFQEKLQQSTLSEILKNTLLKPKTFLNGWNE